MDAIARQLVQLEATYDRFIAISQRRDAERKRDLVTRKTFSEQLLALERLIKDEPGAVIDAELKREFGKRLTKVRSALAYHQAS